MIPEIGLFALVLAQLFAFMLVIIPAVGLWRRHQLLLNVIRPYVFGQFFFVALAYSCLTLCFLRDDFSVQYVVAHSSIALPWFYKACAAWGGHEGSMLLWISILSGWMLLLILTSKSLEAALFIRILVVLAVLSIGFLLFLLVTSNPFARQFQFTQGQDLNPFLQDLGFLFHPPMLYSGYVGFAVAFAFAIAALWLGKIDRDWIKWTRIWVLASWSCLTAGITLGSWWAYRELGWGGWWYWDPVENASFMPWLVGIALLHSLAGMQKQQQLKPWTLLLAIMAFSLSLMGTFLVRSGILTSVHAFAVDPQRGFFILIFLTIVIGGSLLLFACRTQKLQVNAKLSLVTKESILLLNNILLIVIMCTILLGTVYPLLIDLFGLGKLSVGAPYFNTVLIPLFIPLLFLIGLGVHCNWQRDSAYHIIKKLWKIFSLANFSAMVLLILYAKEFNFLAFLGLSLALWIILSNVKLMLRGVRLASLAMLFAHSGVAIMVIGITISSIYAIQKDVRLAPGQTVELAGYRIVWLEDREAPGPNYHGLKATFAIYKKNYAKLIYPEKRIYNVGKMAMTEAAIDANLWRDIYVALGEPISSNAWSVRVYYKPFVRWIWVGGFLIFSGGILGLVEQPFKLLRAIWLVFVSTILRSQGHKISETKGRRFFK